MRDRFEEKQKSEMKNDYVSFQMFVPAGRSFFTSLGKAIAAFEYSGLLDPLTVRFGRFFTTARERVYRRAFVVGDDGDSRRGALIREHHDMTKQLFGGEIRFGREQDYVESSDGRKIPFGYLSSGQQELLPLWLILESVYRTNEGFEQMTQGLTEPQLDLLGQVMVKNKAVAGIGALQYCIRVRDALTKMTVDGRKEGTRWAIVRSLNIVINRLVRMKNSNDLMRRRLSELSFEPLPNPVAEADKIVRPGQISIIYLGGYDHITQCSIAAITFDSLFDHRASLSGVIPPFIGVVEEAHTFIPSAREGTSEAVSLPVIRRIITEGRKFGTGLILISQRPSRVDETIISQCNSFLVLRLVNPRDQTYVQNIMENLSKSDARLLPGFGPGQGIVSGQIVRFPLPVKIEMDTELLASEIGDEDFIQRVAEWKPDKSAAQRGRNRNAIDKIKAVAGRRSASKRR